MLQQFRQLGNVGRDPPGLVTGKELRRRVPARLLLEIDVREGLARMILHDETGVRFFDRPGRRGKRRRFCGCAKALQRRYGEPQAQTAAVLGAPQT